MKAIQFYQRASDFNRTNALIDRALWRCCTALVTTSIALSASDSMESSSSSSSSNPENNELYRKYLFLIPRNLKLHPVAVRDARVAGEIYNAQADFIDLRHYPESNSQNSEISKAVTPDLGNLRGILFFYLYSLII